MKRTVLITGASRGIGRAIARRFAEGGDRLILVCRNNLGLLEELREECLALWDTQAFLFAGDLARKETVDDLFAQIAAAPCDWTPDVVINCAGISRIGLIQDMSFEEWREITDTNLTAAFSLIKAAIPGMLAKGGGKILNISSVWGCVGASCEAAYSATKGGVNALTMALGKELAPSNIQVNAIACGCIDTEMNAFLSDEDRAALLDEIPAGRMGTPEEVAHLAWQLTDGNAYLTSQVIRLDGGWI